MNTEEPRAQTPTVLAEPPWLQAVYLLGFPALGAGAGWLLRRLADWALGLAWIPFQGPLELIDSVPEPHLTIGVIVVGALAGLVLGFVAQHESLTVTVTPDRVVLDREDTEREFDRAQISAVFREGDRLVLLGRRGEELANHPSELSTAHYAAAFREHGYPWAEGDPHAEEFRRWVPDQPELPTGANALFTARDKALGGNKSDDAKELRAELAKLGVVVKDGKGKRQYWRLTGQDSAS
ncbi:YqeB family protein [Amycolatopsis cihanbeyliensis]|uniref:Uncharacterized protein n=1 Tax=Amycolatopsis cihanbeyliensis TaxID=1128664 RepID=A0A542DPD9_AMYCI|nr:hypothetical protein [Amycolatopsis cihanbeyliensis]TQJ04971.1 hypothetical protein FB471_4783 [Amycolatopsis cihanbeyliensis]